MDRRQIKAPTVKERRDVNQKMHLEKGIRVTDIMALVTSITIATVAIATFIYESRQTRIELKQIQIDFKDYKATQKDFDIKQDIENRNNLQSFKNEVKSDINRLESVILQLFKPKP